LDGEIPDALRIKTKNYLENTRSILDYIASDICVYVLKLGAKHKAYFPLQSQSPEHFAKLCKANFPRIESIAPELYTLLRGIQPFESAEFECFRQLAEYSNANKHRDLSAQTFANEKHLASRFMVVRFGDLGETGLGSREVDGYMIADETRSDPFLGSDFIINNIGKVIELPPSACRYISPKFTDSGDDVIVTLINIQSALRKVVELFAEPLYACSASD
jgi:hypothetical protein